VGEVSLSGPDVNDFAVVADACTRVLMHERESCPIAIQFRPTFPGARHATLTVQPAGRAPVDIDLTGGVGVPPEGFTADPNPLAFGQRLALSPSGPGRLRISNQGRLPFTILSITKPGGAALAPGDYAIPQNTCLHRTLKVNEICAMNIVFTPHGSGPRNGAVEITTRQDGTPRIALHLIGLTGSGPAPALQVNPGVVASGQVASVTGRGFAPNRALVVKIAGLPLTFTPTTLADGSFTLQLIVFRHTTTGTYTATATLPGTNLTAKAPVLVVSGSGQPPGFEIRG
jgi:hypothetical protein